MEEAVPKRSLEELLVNWLDSTSIWNDGRVYKTKGYVERVRDLKIYVYSGDHPPPHFHVVSTQRDIDATFHLHTRGLRTDKTNKIKRDDIKRIKAFFEIKCMEDKLYKMYELTQKK